jgi:hypothetical protein
MTRPDRNYGQPAVRVQEVADLPRSASRPDGTEHPFPLALDDHVGRTPARPNGGSRSYPRSLGVIIFPAVDPSLFLLAALAARRNTR